MTFYKAFVIAVLFGIVLDFIWEGIEIFVYGHTHPNDIDVIIFCFSFLGFFVSYLLGYKDSKKDR